MNSDRTIGTGAGVLFILAVVASITGLDSDSSSLLTTGKLLQVIHDWKSLFGSNFLLVPGTLITGYILYKSNLFPRLISVLNLMGGPLIFISALQVLFGLFLELSVWGLIFMLPVFAYEIFLAIWQIMKDFSSTAIGSEML